MEFENTTPDITQDTAGDSVDVDGILSELENPTAREIPMTQPEPKAAAPDPAQAQAAQEFEFTWNGKQIKAPVDKVKQWAQQGYDYAQKMQAINERETRYKEWESKYKPVDDYIKQDPQWWEHVQQSYAQRLQGLQGQQTQAQSLDPSHPVSQEIAQLRAQFNELAQFKQAITQEREAQRIATEDQQLNTAIESIRKEYPDLDLAQVDDSGKTLELRVMEYGIQNGIKDFQAAFKLFNHEALIKRAEERGKEHVQKDLQKKTKLGLLGKTQAPTRAISEARDIKSKSYEDILDEAKLELGLA